MIFYITTAHCLIQFCRTFKFAENLFICFTHHIGQNVQATPVSHADHHFLHVVLGRDETLLDLTREHERVHVRQCERWGPLFLPAYLLASVLVFLRGGRAYLDNPFEREAYAACP